jgi:hypothetical protein
MKIENFWKYDNLDETLTLMGLRTNTLDKVKRAAKFVRVKLLKTTRGKDQAGIYDQYTFETKSILPNESIDETVLPMETPDGTHITRIRIYETAPLNSKTARTWIDCTCEDFRFRWDFALNKKGSSGMLRAKKGVRPNETNPNETAAVCKHAYAAMEFLKKKKGL